MLVFGLPNLKSSNFISLYFAHRIRLCEFAVFLIAHRFNVRPDGNRFLGSQFLNVCTGSGVQYTIPNVQANISIIKPTRCTISQTYFILEQHSTCFRRSFRPSSGA
jgi:hypothetical protein